MAIDLQQAASTYSWLNNVSADCLRQLRMYLHSVSFGFTAPRAAAYVKRGGLFILVPCTVCKVLPCCST